DAPKKSPWKKAVNLGMAKADGASMTDRFKMIKDAGFDGVELNRPDAIPLEDLVKAREATGLEIAGIICSTHWGKPITHQDPAVREQGMRGLKLSLQEAGELGCKRLLLVPGVVSKEVSYADAYKRSQAGIREAIPVAEKAGCKIAVENVWNQFLLSPLEAARFVDELDSPWVGWHFDIGNVVTFGWPEQWIRTLGPRILNIHIKEYSRKKRDQAGPYKGFEVELGEGDVGWPDVVKALNDVAYKGYAVLEVPGGDATRLKFLAERTDKILTS
ncbi:MAG TPA: sugar phosphate isomerase/epimerase family protein, partial [Chthoniobacteraceae bacterium]|nr:sugar phosphate isomerase/epimerase family protein [Chthoniobacteraceae bacterium]